MGKGSGKGIAVIALIISLLLGGYIVFDKFFIASKITATDTPPTYQYFKLRSMYEFIPALEEWTSGSYLLIEFILTEGQSVFFSFEGLVLFDDSSIPNTYIEVRFKVDGIIWNYPRRRVWRYNVVSDFGFKFSISMQNYNATMSAGTHNVTVVCKGDHPADYITDRSLFVQTFN